MIQTKHGNFFGRRIIGLFVGILLTAGCVSTSNEYTEKELKEVSFERIENDAAEGAATRAMEGLFLLEMREEVDGPAIDELTTVIKNKLRENLLQALKEEDYSKAIRLTVSAEQAAWGDVLESTGAGEARIDSSSLMRKRILWYLDNDQPIRGLAFVRKLTDLSICTDDDLVRILQTAMEEEKYTVVKRVSAVLDSRKVKVPIELPDSSAYRYSQEELLAGTVTIWVNRGMTIQEGVGLPDRVIGSGFYIDRRGYIITNYHVIQSQVDPEYEGYSRLFIRPSEDPDIKIPARVIGWDAVFDIALLKVETESETVFSFSASERQVPGERIYAIGSPAGLENTITSGIVSATDRRFLQMGNVIQVDVPINQGNSGGPLLDNEGNLIGVVFAGIEQFEGINFAIPVRWLIHIFPDLYEQGSVIHSFLGVALQKNGNTMEIMYVLPNSPADRIGLEAGDILSTFADQPIRNMIDAHDAILEFTPGTLVKIEWERGSEKRKSYAMLEERPRIPLETAIEYDQPERLFAPAFGMQVEKIQDNIMGTRYVVTKVYQGGIADDTGFSVNDPFSLQQWKYLTKEKVLLAQVRIKKRKAGFLETGVQLGTYAETTNFL